MERLTNKIAPLSLPLPRYVIDLIDRLEANGEEAYVVGGSLRDLLLGIPPHDYDLATSAPPERTSELFSSDHRVIETGLKHGTVTVLCDGAPVEITTFRIDGDYTDARHPDQVTFTRRITEDLARRDFTVNAMAYHPTRGLVDPFGGRKDLQCRRLRAVGDPNLRFEEDALRIMRAFRFSAQLAFEIEEQTLQGCRDSKSKLTFVAKERIASEFLRLLTSPDPVPALKEMLRSEILSYVTESYLPQEAHLDRIAATPREEAMRLALYFSDGDREIARQSLRALKLSHKQITATCAILSCMDFPVATPAEARHLISSCGVYAPSAVRLSVLLGVSAPEAVALVEKETHAPCTISDLAISGKELMAIGIKGKAIGNTLQALLSVVLEAPERNTPPCLLALAKEWQANKEIHSKN